VDMLRERGAEHIRVFGGGGGTITPEEIQSLIEYGVERIYHPNDGMQLGLEAMIQDLVARTHKHRRAAARVEGDDDIARARTISAIEQGLYSDDELSSMRKGWQLKAGAVPVVGITGTGGAGKSSVTDEILNRFLQSFEDRSVAVVAVDPTRRRTGGALLGDRIRMNTLRSPRTFMRSIATRRQHLATSDVLGDVVAYLKSQGFDMVIVETAGIGQSDSEIVDLVDFSVYVMTSDYGAASQLEKIDMIDYADLIVLNKFDKRGAKDALRDVRKQWRRNHLKFNASDDETPVFPTIASQFNDPGVSVMFDRLCALVADKVGLDKSAWTTPWASETRQPDAVTMIPGARIRYLAEISEGGRAVNAQVDTAASAATRAQHLYESLGALNDPKRPSPLGSYADEDLAGDDALPTLRRAYQDAVTALP
ncbi:MAG: GTP-binding protein, partial [Pseudomonadota bacterium]